VAPGVWLEPLDPVFFGRCLALGVCLVSSLPVDRGAPSSRCRWWRKGTVTHAGGGTEIEANLEQGWALDLAKRREVVEEAWA
jgi:hypothetical protein